MPITKGRDPISSGLALNAFRSQGFSPTTAICEIIDNSIEANATQISIDFNWKKITFGERIKRVEEYIFKDNGFGMDIKTLYDCLVLGEGTKRLGAKGIGRFGVGATFSGISQGKEIEIYSKTSNGDWNYTRLDLDLLDQGEGILEPEVKTPPTKLIKDLEKQGTIIIWKKIDKSQFKQNDVEKLKNEIGRIYRKFLTDKKIEEDKLIKNTPIKILVENNEVQPYDPLYVTHNPRKEDDEKITFKSIPVPLRLGELRGKMFITITKLPESWWDTHVHPGTDPVNTKERKLTGKNEGISIVRGGREVHYDTIPYFKLTSGTNEESSTDVRDRFTSIEISFERDSDEIFGIQNNKSRVLLSTYVMDKIAEAISDTIIDRREYFTTYRNEKKADKEGEGVTDFPGPPPVPEPEYDKSQKDTLREYAEQLYSNKEKQNEAFEDLVKGYHPRVSFDLDSTGPFVSYGYELDSIIVTYNGKHPFMQKFFSTLEELAEKRGGTAVNALNVEEVKKIKRLFDILLASFGLARKRFPSLDEKAEIESTINTVINSWADIAHQITKGKTY
jgi:hypothetical protein